MLPPKNIVYWASKSKNPDSSGVHNYKSDFKVCKDRTSATILSQKLQNLMKNGGTYRGRYVYHVSDIYL